MSQNNVYINISAFIFNTEATNKLLKYLIEKNENNQKLLSISDEDATFLKNCKNFELINKEISFDIIELKTLAEKHHLAVEIYTSFYGHLIEYTKLDENEFNESNMNDDSLLFIPLDNQPTLFKPAYNSPMDVIREIRQKLNSAINIGDQNIINNLYKIVGEIY